MPTSDLARQLAAHPRFRWAEGMAYHENAVPGTGLCRSGRGRVWDEASTLPHAATPDLADAATAGVLVAMLDEAIGGRWTLALVTLLDEDVARILPNAAAIGLGEPSDLPCLGEAAARALLALLPPEVARPVVRAYLARDPEAAAKVAGPWDRREGMAMSRRWAVGTDRTVGWAAPSTMPGMWTAYTPDAARAATRHPTRAEAEAAVDALLVGDGWVLGETTEVNDG